MVYDVAVVAGDRLDAEIDVRREAAVQRELAFAVLESPFARGEVDEREAHRLLELVHAIALEGEDRDVRLDGGDRSRGFAGGKPREQLLAACRAGRSEPARPPLVPCSGAELPCLRRYPVKRSDDGRPMMQPGAIYTFDMNLTSGGQNGFITPGTWTPRAIDLIQFESVRWDDGTDCVFFPGSDARFVHPHARKH